MIRIIPRLDIKNNTIVKGIQFDGLRVVGKPDELAKKYYEDGADELLYIDAVASLYGRNSLEDIVKNTAKNIFIPLTVGGGIRSIGDIEKLLKYGADKVAINTSAIKNPTFLQEASHIFGSQCIVLSVQAKKISNNNWEAYYDSGRERSKKSVIEWIAEAISLGVGEVLLTSVDNDGTKYGFDIELIEAVSKMCSVPLIVSGGAGRIEDIDSILKYRIDGISVGTILHYNIEKIRDLKEKLKSNR